MAAVAPNLEQTIEINPLGPAIGAEISNVDLTQPLTPEQFFSIHQAWMKHQVLFFRDQDLSLEQRY